MTTQQPDRLDRIEAILEGLGIKQAQFQQQLEGERQQRLESGDQFQQQLEETRKIADSNARSNQANSAAIAANSTAISELKQTLEVSIADVVDMITTQAIEAAADRAELRRMIEAMYGDLRQRQRRAIGW